jgi:hypothetical protein
VTVRLSVAPLGGASIANLTPNGGFEVNASPWSPGGQANSTLSASSAQAKFGAQSMLVTTNGAGAFAATISPAGGPTAQVGQSFLLSAWVFVPAGSPAVQLEMYGAVSPSVQSAFSSATGQWQQLFVVGTASSVTGVGHGLVATATAAGQQCYVDGVSLTLLSPSSRPVLASRPVVGVVPGSNAALWSVTGYGSGGAGTAAVVGDAFRQTWTTKPSPGGGGSLTHDGQRVPVAPGQALTGVVWTRHSHAITSGILKLFWMDAGGSQVGTPFLAGFVPTPNVWERRLVSDVAPAGAVYARLEVRIQDASEAAAVLPFWQEVREVAVYLGV